MHANGYLEQSNRHPASLGAATTIVLGAVAAMLAYQPQIVERLKDDTTLIQIVPPKPPEPVDPVEPKQQVRQPQSQQPQSIDPLVKTDTTQTVYVTPLPQPPQLPQPPLPPGPETIAPRQPVLIAAAIDGRRSGDLQPPYPAGLERAEVEGSVTVRVEVGIDGRVTAVELIRASDPGFFDATRETALRKWRFKPATRDGVPFSSWVTKTVTFRILRG